MSAILEAVYYSGPAPGSLASLTALSFVFDRLYFPGVFISDAIDLDGARQEFERIVKIGVRSRDDLAMLRCIQFALHAHHLRDFCIFTGKFGCLGTMESGVTTLADEIETAMFGPAPGFPIITGGFAKGLPGGEESSVNGPSFSTYPANALLYAASNDLLLINDDPMMPVPWLGGTQYKDCAKTLATILAFESIKLVLPKLKVLTPEQIAEFRHDTKELITPFRMAMLKLSKDLNDAIKSESTSNEVMKHARFLVETTVLPELEEVRALLTEPSSNKWERFVDLAKSAPQLIGNYLMMDPLTATGKVLEKTAEVLLGVQKENAAKIKAAKRGGFHYLLKIENG